MFRFILPTVLFSTAIFIGACSPSNERSSEPSKAKEVVTEIQNLDEAKDDSQQRVETEAKLAQEAQRAEKKQLAQEARLAEDRLLAEKDVADLKQRQIERGKRIQSEKQVAEKQAAEKQVAEKQAAEKQAAARKVQKIEIERNAADRAAAQAQLEAQKAEAAQKAQSLALLAKQKRMETAEQLRLQEAAKLQAEALKDRVIASGTFTKKKKAIKGSWSLVTEDGKRYLRFDDAFKTKWVDDLQIFLSPQSITAANHKNAGQNVYRLAPLKSKKGAQSYAIPDDVDLSIYNSILIHCEEYDLLWGGTNIR